MFTVNRLACSILRWCSSPFLEQSLLRLIPRNYSQRTPRNTNRPRLFIHDPDLPYLRHSSSVNGCCGCSDDSFGFRADVIGVDLESHRNVGFSVDVQQCRDRCNRLRQRDRCAAMQNPKRLPCVLVHRHRRNHLVLFQDG